MTTPSDLYQTLCKKNVIIEDNEQLIALKYLDVLHGLLLKENKMRYRLRFLLRKNRLLRGVYLWGGVGIGKTFLMDCFYRSLTFEQKKRMHFHQFMRWVHQELKQQQGQKNPLNRIAKKIADHTLVICFDELCVSDIADAMLLRHLFKALFDQGVCLVATSNAKPDDLYQNGLQRNLFLPAIEQLKENLTVLHLPTQVDYRLQHLSKASVYYTPNDKQALQNMDKTFNALTYGQVSCEKPIELCGRPIKIIKQAGKTIWFDFKNICSTPRSQHDYLAIAENYTNVFISNIPAIPPHANDTISLFIRMIDVFYDSRIRLICDAETSIEKIYESGFMSRDYVRTKSRLLEMQSEHYFQ